jgi:hypothetical protein
VFHLLPGRYIPCPQVHLLALVLDGSAAKGEKHLWQACCERAGPNVAQFSEARVMYTAARFKRTHTTLEAYMLLEAFDPSSTAAVPTYYTVLKALPW